MIELLTQKYREPFSDQVLLVRELGPKPGYDPQSVEFLVYRILKQEQRVLKDRDKGLLDNSSRRWIWKPFQNYKIWSGKPVPYGPTYYDQYWGLPPVNHYVNASPLPSSYSGYWYYTTLTGNVPHEPFGEAGRLNLDTTINGASSCPPFYVPSEKGFVSPPADISILNQRAINAMMPNIKADLSSLNSLYELKDFKPLVDAIVKLKPSRALALNVLRWIKLAASSDVKVLEMPLSSLSRFVAGNFLQWKFAISPLISDITALQAVITKYKSRLNNLVSREGRLQTKHFTAVFDEFTNHSDWETGPTGFIRPFEGFNACIDYVTRRRVIHEPTVFHAQIQYNYNYTGYQRQHAATLSALDSLGVNFNPAILWNALPFSFVLDWFVNIGDQFETFKIGNMEPQINVHQYLWSVKRKRTIYADVGIKPDTTSLVPSPDKRRLTLPPIHEEVYGRFTDYPVTGSQLLATGLNSSEFTLGAALITVLTGKKRGAR